METTPTLETPAQAPTQDIPSSSTQAFNSNAALARSVKKASQALHRSLRKRTTVIHKFVEGLSPGQRKNLNKKFRCKSGDLHAGGRRPVFDDDKKNFLIKFLEGADISYTMPGRKDQVDVGKDKDGKSFIMQNIICYEQSVIWWTYLIIVTVKEALLQGLTRG